MIERHPRRAVEDDPRRRVERELPPFAWAGLDAVTARLELRRDDDRGCDPGGERTARDAPSPDRGAVVRSHAVLPEVLGFAGIVRGLAKRDVGEERLDRKIGALDLVISVLVRRIFGQPSRECLPSRVVAMLQSNMPFDRAQP
nr:hypothetical protein [Sphingomonas nostoxanthinifaciens]